MALGRLLSFSKVAVWGPIPVSETSVITWAGTLGLDYRLRMGEAACTHTHRMRRPCWWEHKKTCRIVRPGIHI